MFYKIAGATVCMLTTGFIINNRVIKLNKKKQLVLESNIKEEKLGVSSIKNEVNSDNKPKLKLKYSVSRYSNYYFDVHEFKNIPDYTVCLDLSDNDLETIPDLYHLTNLESINLSNNKLREVPEWISKLHKLEYINCNRNFITEIPKTLPHNLTTLYLGNNLITEIPKTLPNKLEYLSLSHNSITDVPELHLPNLTYLNLRNNFIHNLPNQLPTELYDISLAGNLIKKLPTKLPPKLKFLDLSNNLITKLPNQLPNKLFCLKLSDNKITTIPDSIIKCDKLEILYLDNNKIVELPKLPVLTRRIRLDNNPIDISKIDLSYLPKYDTSPTRKNSSIDE